MHNNTSLSATEKFAYLRSFLEGRARDVIAGLALTDVNYPVAVEIPEKRFGDKEKVIAAQMDDLMSTESVHSDGHIQELRRLHDRTESNIRSLEALGVGVDPYVSLLTPIFVKKLPSQLRLDLAHKIPTDEWNIANILKLFLRELEARERTAWPNKHKQNLQSHSTHRRGRDFPTTRTSVSGGESGCCYCGEEHHASAQCRKVSSIEARKCIIRESGRCFTCLRRGHLSRDCRTALKCRGRHHSSICTRMHKTRPQNGEEEHLQSSCSEKNILLAHSESRLNPECASFQPPDSSATLHASNRNEVLLQVA